MPTASYVRGSFLGGERSKFAQGRYDLQDYATGLNVCLNGLPVESGAWVRRPGTRFLGQTFGGHFARLIPFAFKNALPYVCELTESVLRLWAGTNTTDGISLATTNDAQVVTAISTATPAEFTTTSAHGKSNGDHAYFTNTGTGVTTLQNREFVITVTAANKFTAFDQVTGEPINGAALGGVPPGLTVNFPLKLGSPYTAAQIPAVRKVQAETTAVFLHPANAPRALSVLTPPSAGTFATFSSLVVAALSDGPYLDQYIGTTVTPSGMSGSITLQTAGAPFPGFQAGDVGRLVRLFSQPAAWNPASVYAAGNVVAQYQDPVNYPTVASYFQAIGATTAGLAPSGTPSQWTLVTGTSFAIWTWATITAVNNSGNVTVTINGSALLYTSVIYAWRLGAYGGANGFPSCGTYHEGRIWLGGAIANRFDACVSNGISISSSGATTINFAPTDPSGAVGAANAITGTLNAENTNPILWMKSHQQGVLAGTQGSEFLLFAPTAGAIAPNNIAAHPLTTIGGLNVEAASCEHTVVFVHRFSRKLMEYFPDVFSGKFAAPVVNWLSKHLTAGGIQEIAYQQELAPNLWARVGNALRGWVYKRESLVSANPPTIAAGHRHVLGSGRIVESIATGPSVGGTTDTLMLATNDPLINVRYVEALSDIPDEGQTLLDAQYVDCAIAPSWVVAAPIAQTMPYGGMAMSGLWALNGKTVSAWVGGLDCGDYTVANGSITVPFGDGISAGTANGLLTQSYVQGIDAIPIWVGYTYTSDGQIVRPNSPQETGARNGPGFMKLRRTNWFGLQLEGAVTGSISFGTSFESLQAVVFKHPGSPSQSKAYTVLEQFDGIFRDVGKDSDSFDSQICWRITRPYPANICAVGGALETKDI